MAHGGACGAEHDEPLATRALSGEWSGEPRPKPATRKNVFNGIRHHRDKGDTSSGSICYIIPFEKKCVDWLEAKMGA